MVSHSMRTFNHPSHSSTFGPIIQQVADSHNKVSDFLKFRFIPLFFFLTSPFFNVNSKMTNSFPAKLRPELLSPVLDEMRQNNPAIPGSGLVSLCGTLALPKDPLNRFPPSTPQFLRSQSLNLPMENPSSFSPTNGLTNEVDGNNISDPGNRHLSMDENVTPLSARFQKLFDHTEPERCPLCFRKFTLFTRKTMCEQCQRNVCSSCLHEFVTNGVVYLCKDCLEIT